MAAKLLTKDEAHALEAKVTHRKLHVLRPNREALNAPQTVNGIPQ